MTKNMYSKDGYSILGVCGQCGRINYVEQHGVTAPCKCNAQWTEHSPIPYKYRVGVCHEQYCGPRRLSLTGE